MTAFHENHSNVLEENLRDILPDASAPAGTTNDAAFGTSNPYTRAENPSNSGVGASPESELDADEAFGENAGLNMTNHVPDYDLSAGPGDEDDDDDDDDDDFLDDEDETLIPIEGDEEDDDSLLSADDDEDVTPESDLDDEDLDDDDDDYDEDSTINRSTLGDIGSNNTSRDAGRSTGRMIDHEPGTSEV